ncbi:MAG: 50S ribosomal protein L18 [Thermodesulfobacteriota bacterium]|nr:MAG: 50S ribosomal protein L18 [Thermodesulfobacteriota bacterium]
MKIASRKSRKNLRHKRVRKQINGSTDRPRLSVFKSSKHIYAQIIDDVNMNTLVSASSLTPKVIDSLGKDSSGKIDVASAVGKLLGELAVAKGIKKVSFDRGGYPFHGRVKSLADGAREAGLEF